MKPSLSQKMLLSSNNHGLVATTDVKANTPIRPFAGEAVDVATSELLDRSQFFLDMQFVMIRPTAPFPNDIESIQISSSIWQEQVAHLEEKEQLRWVLRSILNYSNSALQCHLSTRVSSMVDLQIKQVEDRTLISSDHVIFHTFRPVQSGHQVYYHRGIIYWLLQLLKKFRQYDFESELTEMVSIGTNMVITHLHQVTQHFITNLVDIPKHLADWSAIVEYVKEQIAVRCSLAMLDRDELESPLSFECIRDMEHEVCSEFYDRCGTCLQLLHGPPELKRVRFCQACEYQQKK